MSTSLNNTTRKPTRTFERKSIISETRNVILTSTISLTMKKKYAAIKNTSKSSVIWTQPSSHSTSTTPQITTVMIPKGPQHS